MKKKLFILALFVFLIFLIVYKLINYYKISKNKLTIYVLYSPVNREKCEYVISAYESVLEEEGVPFKSLSYENLFLVDIDKDFVRSHPALILPDCAMQSIHPDLIKMIRKYLELGGSLLLVYDPGIKDLRYNYLDKTLFAEILGINYATYSRYKEKSYTLSPFIIVQPEFLGLTPGKLDKRLRLIKGYVYGPLVYPVSRVEIYDEDYQVLAKVQIEGKELPGAVLKKVDKGNILWVNLPLGHLKAYSDDLPLRMFLRTFLFKILHIPHLVNSSEALGHLIINWHVDANPDWISIPYMIENKIVRPNLRYSWHITAGDFRDKPGDGLGFDACEKGKKIVELIFPYGTIGSHGGWAHNWFSEGVLQGKFSPQEIEEYIVKNNLCLESITGYKIVEYSSPNGVHPQPLLTQILEKLGMTGYYYVGDTGSPPNRTFYNGKMVSKKVFAFPVINYGDTISLHEMWKKGVPKEELDKFFADIINFIKREKTIRLWYSHPYDIPLYIESIQKFIDLIEKEQAQGLIKVSTMKEISEFLERFLSTKVEFSWVGDRSLRVSLKNPRSLKDIAFAIPKDFVLKSNVNFLQTKEDEFYKYYVIKTNVKSFDLLFISN